MPVVVKGTGGGGVTLDAGTASSNTTLTLPNTTGSVLVAPGGILPVTAGGTGVATLAANNVVLGNGTSALQVVAPGTSGNVLTSNGTTWASTTPSVPTPSVIGQIPFSTNGSTYTATQKIVQGTAVASTSGTAIDFTSIPSWVKRVTVMFSTVSTTGTSTVQVQLGTSSGVETSSYTSANSVTQSGVQYYSITTGIGITGTWAAAAYIYTGAVVFYSLGSNTWIAQGGFGGGSSNYYLISGTKTLTAVLDRIRITTVNGTDTFDAGSINILYE